MEPVGTPGPTSPAPPELRPRGTPPGSDSPGSGSLSRTTLLLLGGVFGLAIAVVLVLPKMVASPEPSSTPVTEPPAATQPAPDSVTTPVPTEEARREAELALQRYLKRRAELELLNADTWAAETMAQAAAGASAGDRLFGQRRFVEARNDYSAAEEQLAELAVSRPQRLTEALQAGWQHLEADDGPAAAEQFTLALILEPGLVDAELGLARAEVRPAVLERMAVGRIAETSGQLEAARQAFLEAAGLDAEFTPAVEAAARIAAVQADTAFGSAMSRALAAIETGRYAAAGKALDEAARLRPGDQVVTDARRRLVAARRAAELTRLRREGDRKTAEEAWTEAEAIYRSALKIDPAAGFANHGLERASARARLHARIDDYLAAPPRLYSPEPLAEAERMLADSTPIPAGEPQLAAKTRQLATLVNAAKQPRSVRLRSDGETEVTVYHVGRLGRFAEQTLQLRPGSYTVVGARPGYRDVRITFTVAPDQPSPSVDVRCRELL